MRQYQSVEEIFLYVPDTGFDTAFFVWPSHVTSTWLEAVVCCKVQVPRMKERPFSSRMLEHCGLRIVDEDFGRNSAKKLQSVLVSGQDVLCRFAQAKLGIAQTAVAKHHDKEGETSASGTDRHRAGAAPIDLRAFARSEHQGKESWRAHGPHSTHIVCEDGDSAAISLLGTQPLEDLRGAIGMLLQPALDDWLVRIELALSPGSEVLGVGLLARPLCYRLFIEVQLTADLGKA